MTELSVLVLQWIQKAEEDWEAARLLSVRATQASTTCFHCQQCAEKPLKAALLAAGCDIPKIHELEVLSDLLTHLDPDWEWDRDDLDDLTTGAVTSRYPGYEMTPEDVAATMAATAQLRQALLLRLGISPTEAKD